MEATASSQPGRLPRWLLTSGIGILIVAVVAMWAVEIVDAVVLDDRLQRGGIHPRKVDGLDGILWAPFLHSGMRHLFSNTVPLLVMGGLVAARGLPYWRNVTLAAVFGGGVLTWLLAGGSNHVGASGVVFGYFGALLGAAFFERRIQALGGALIAIFLYSGMVAGLVPQPQLSWEGHLFGLIAGVVASKLMAEDRPRRPGETPASDPLPWELDEPWLD